MRLKFLFFPVMLIVSVALFFGYVWPDINTVGTLKEEKAGMEKQLAQADEKQKAIDTVNVSMKQDPAATTAILTYLPQKRAEEKIINNLNFMATSESVVLTNLSIVDIAPKVPEQSTMPVGATPINATGDLAGASAVMATPENSMQFSEATLQLSGTYDNLSVFINKLQHEEMYNKVKSLSITADNQEKPELLSANIVVDFGYLLPTKLNSQNIDKLKPGFNTNFNQELQKYIAQKTVNIDLGSIGRTNPFQL